ncbi:hypothetical protein [Nocardiopsis sp. JB363]|uniref:hypothetical protein n=1 Tax=Nocardiopsis sp. JB363 TaxID=1434837 RepID=UPI00097A2ADF|nr:hypothetical protein [Nocardiopsis sp. JB363]SIO85076.1 hypothetical protein BQ8420_05135 [Nocardiopsis sp. JB363]
MELNEGESERHDQGPAPTASEDEERVRELPRVRGLVTLGSEDAPVCSDGICF